jgi:hypothetical protein
VRTFRGCSPSRRSPEPLAKTSAAHHRADLPLGSTRYNAQVNDDPLQHDALLIDLANLPGEIYAAFHAVMKEAVPLRDTERRQRFAIVVCECNDPKAREFLDALARELGRPIQSEPGKAAALIHLHADVARLARALGHEFANQPDPPIGRMRVFLFVGGRVIVTTMLIVSEAEVLLREAEEADLAAAEARRTFEQKEAVISRAVGLLQTMPGLLQRKIVVVFGSRSRLALAVYRELATLPEQKDFPPELPANASVISVTYEDFMRALRRHDGGVPGIDAGRLGPNQVRVATFTSEGIYMQRMEALAVSRGGSA